MNSNAVKEIAVKIEKTGERIKEIFDNVDLLMNNVYNNENWQGQTNTAYYERYLKLKEYFPKVLEGINTYSVFLNDAGVNYEDKENDLNRNVEFNDDNLNVS